jgi:hypothetical protein
MAEISMSTPALPPACRWLMRCGVLEARYDAQDKRWIYFIPRKHRWVTYVLKVLTWLGLA